jgi:hypothetical protein
MRVLLSSILVAAAVAACGPVDKSAKRPLVSDETPLGMARAEVKSWHTGHDWCVGRTWEESDEYVPCNDPVMKGAGAEGPIRSFFHFDGERLISSAVYAPVSCTRAACRHPIQVGTELEGPPFIAFDAGLTETPVDAGRGAPPEIELNEDVHNTMDAMRKELERRFGAPVWKNAQETAMVWQGTGEQVGLFVSADARWVVEAHQANGG